MNEAKFEIYNVDGSYRDFIVSAKELKDMLVPDNGMPFTLVLSLTDKNGFDVRLAFDNKGVATIAIEN